MRKAPKQLGRVLERHRRNRLAQRLAQRHRQRISPHLDAGGAASHTLFDEDAADDVREVVGVEPVGSDIGKEGRLAGERQVDIAQHQRRRVVALGQDHGLRAVDANPAVVAAEIVEVLERDDDQRVEPGAGHGGTRPRDPALEDLAGEGGEVGLHNDLAMMIAKDRLDAGPGQARPCNTVMLWRALAWASPEPALWLLFAARNPQEQEATMPANIDLIVTNARVITMDEANPRAEAVAISGNEIAAVGSKADIEGHEGQRYEGRRCGGRHRHAGPHREPCAHLHGRGRTRQPRSLDDDRRRQADEGRARFRGQAAERQARLRQQGSLQRHRRRHLRDAAGSRQGDARPALRHDGCGPSHGLGEHEGPGTRRYLARWRSADGRRDRHGAGRHGDGRAARAGRLPLCAGAYTDRRPRYAGLHGSGRS